MASLPTKLLLDAAKRLADQRGQPFTIVHRGDPDSGQIMLCLYDIGLRTTLALKRERNWDDDGFSWVAAKQGKQLDAVELSDFIERSTNIDPDLWVVEVDVAAGSGIELNPFQTD